MLFVTFVQSLYVKKSKAIKNKLYSRLKKNDKPLMG
jgi:hypothetical protein